MTKRINRGRLPIPDSRGYVRPEVGGQRFIVGNIKEVGTSEMERRLTPIFLRDESLITIRHIKTEVLYDTVIGRNVDLFSRCNERARLPVIDVLSLKGNKVAHINNFDGFTFP